MKFLFRSRLGEKQAFAVQHRTTFHSTDHHDYHPHYEIYFCEDHIRQSITINGQTLELDQPNLIISAPFSIHSMLPADPDATEFDRYALFFGDAMFTMFDKSILPKSFFEKFSNCIFRLDAAQTEAVKKYFEQMLSQEIAPAEQKLLFAMMINMLMRTVSNENRILYNTSNHYIVEVLQYIYRHLNENVTSDSISEAFHISRAKLDRDFRAFVGQSVHQALVNCRLNCAMDLLVGTKMPVKEVAERCGFENEYYFYAFFKRNTGITPLSFRKKK